MYLRDVISSTRGSLDVLGQTGRREGGRTGRVTERLEVAWPRSERQIVDIGPEEWPDEVQFVEGPRHLQPFDCR
jgi:hypothetical protein